MEAAIPQQPTCELKQAEVVNRMFVIANQQGPTLREPSQGPLHHPAAWLLTLLGVTRLRLFFDPPDVRRVISRTGGLPTARIVIPFVQTEMLRLLGTGR